ncbi:hypothetical protein L1987_10053 [Smallanthus sonchifolius]|uniref:Uncharacterized protein n=1 Tax=Smallanthus sonchifolius TaxID=185202 RepID=A0ACB9JR14_9ASTR|nr:hypothetical protein L1987_10053 [Smallanthus sonchifolius]
MTSIERRHDRDDIAGDEEDKVMMLMSYGEILGENEDHPEEFKANKDDPGIGFLPGSDVRNWISAKGWAHDQGVPATGGVTREAGGNGEGRGWRIRKNDAGLEVVSRGDDGCSGLTELGGSRVEVSRRGRRLVGWCWWLREPAAVVRHGGGQRE